MDEQKVVYMPDEDKKNNKEPEKKPEDKPMSDIPVKPAEHPVTPPPTVTPKPNSIDTIPTAQPNTGSHKAVTTATILAILFIGLGFVGGYLGYKYAPKLKGLITTTADSNTPTADPSITTPESTSAAPTTVANWPVYTNTKYLYTINYPDTWYSQNTNDTKAKSIILTSTNPSSKTDSNLTVTVTAQAANGSDLKTWIETNNTVSGEKTDTLSKLSLDSQDAYQQETTGTTKTLNTYLKQGDFIMTLSYTTDESSFETGKAIYTQIIESIKIATKS